MLLIWLACRWPGGVHSAPQLWDFLQEKRSAYSSFPVDRINAEGFYHPDQHRPGSFFTKGGFFLQDDPRKFDNKLFGIGQVEARTMDPAQRKLLEVTFEAFENAGIPLENIKGTQTGVYLGNFNADHQAMQFRDPDHPLPYVTTGGGVTILSNRISYVFDLKGPSLTLDTACSSAMYALHMAVSAIRNHECEGAIVGGSNLILDPVAQIFTTKLGAISPTSTCHTFDAAADGYARADGFGVLYIMNLQKALERHYPIRAVIRGTATNANGRGHGITHPDAEGQEAVIRQAYRNAGHLNPAETGYFECHGTGTPIGDPIEVTAIGRVFAEHHVGSRLHIGSIKPNLGHSESASAIASIMKAVLAIEKEQIPPTIGVVNPNPSIDFDGARVKVVTEMTRWPDGRLRRASINSFGYGGANAHLILDHVQVVLAECHTMPRLFLPSGSNGTHSPLDEQREFLVPFSAHTPESLRHNIENLAQVIDHYRVEDVAYTLAARRTRYSFRAFVRRPDNIATRGLKFDAAVLAKATLPRDARLCFVFTGQGAQWVGMASGLYSRYPVFSRCIDRLDNILATLSKAPKFHIQDVLRDLDSTSIHQPEISQTVCTAVQIGLVDLLKSWNVKPLYVVGHSSGEITATYAAGRLTPTEAILAAYCRGAAISQMKSKNRGAMIAVGLGASEVSPFLKDLNTVVQIAAINSACSITLSGDREVVQDLHQRFNEKGVFCRILETGGTAYHSHHMVEVGHTYEKLLTSALAELNHLIQKESPPRPPAFWSSSVKSFKSVPDISTNPAYWRMNLESPVNFAEAVENLVEHDPSLNTFVEVGPHPALHGILKQIMKSSVFQHAMGEPVILKTLKRDSNCVSNLLDLGGHLFLQNYPINIPRLNGTPDTHQVSLALPNYAYQYGPILYHENRMSTEWRLRKHLSHDLLGARRAGDSHLRPSWRNVLVLKNVPWLADHKLGPHVTFPAAGYVAMAIEAMRQHHLDTVPEPSLGNYCLRNVTITSALHIPEDDLGTETLLYMENQSSLDSAISAWYRFTITSSRVNTKEWVQNCSGLIRVRQQGKQKCISTDNVLVQAEGWYQKFSEVGLVYGPYFQAMSSLKASKSRNIATASIHLTRTDRVMVGESSYVIHPTALDNCLQLALVASHGGDIASVRSAYIPILLDELTVWDASGKCSAHASAVAELRGSRGLYARVKLEADEGQPLVLGSLRCVAQNLRQGSTYLAQARSSNPFSRLLWKPDIDTLNQVDAQQLFPPPGSLQLAEFAFSRLSKLSAFLLVTIATTYPPTATTTSSHAAQKFFDWAHRWSHHLASYTSYGVEALAASPEDRNTVIEILFSELHDIHEAKIIKRTYENLQLIISGEQDGLQVLLEGNLLTDLYTRGIGITNAYPQLQNILDLIVHKNSRSKIIEIGAGTGGATRCLIRILNADTGHKRYDTYSFTDVSPAFFSSAHQEFKDCRGITFQALDIETDHATQGISSDFDVAVASQVLHATSNIATTLQNVRKLLKPGGKLVLVELTHAHLVTGLVLGTLPDYWKGESDGRMDTPLLNRAQWDQKLRENGFSGIDIVLDDYPSGFETASVIVTTAIELPKECNHEYKKPAVFILADYPFSEVARTVTTKIMDQNLLPRLLSIDDLKEIPRGSRVISLLNIDGRTSVSQDESLFTCLQILLHKEVSLLWISRSWYNNLEIPDSSLMRGLLHTISHESPKIKISHLVFETELTVDCAGLIARQESYFHDQIHSDHWEKIFFVRNGIVEISRIYSDIQLNKVFRAQENLEHTDLEIALHDAPSFKIDFDEPGLFSSMYFKEDRNFVRDLPDEYIEIRVEAIGVNMKDIAVAMGKFDWPYYSTECCGTVHRVGSKVDHLRIGDRVAGAAPGHFENFVRCPAYCVQKFDDQHTATELASMPVSFITAIYSLIHLARLKKGESVLITSASGSLGLAAIQIAKYLGANIYATVGNFEKSRSLETQYGIPRGKIFDSRDGSAANKVAEVTEGNGIDVILSTATGDEMHEIWRCIAPLGRFIELGRTAVLGKERLAMEVFERNATFSSFDLGLLREQRQELFASLMAEVAGLYKKRVIAPIKHVTVFSVQQLQEAMKFIGKGNHMGKVVISYTEPGTKLKVRLGTPKAQLDPEATYLLVGCHGGLGVKISEWLVDRGAKHLVFLSRSGRDASSEPTKLEETLRRYVAEVDYQTCDIRSKKCVQTVVRNCAKTRPIKGVVHAAMILEDVLFEKMTFSQFQSVLDPKVRGTINVHEATLDQPLDFFLMTSSIVTLVGTATQSAYSAANSFQDDFAQYRRSKGLPALSLALGMISDVGFASSRPHIQRSLIRNGIYGTHSSDVVKLLDIAFTSSNPDLDVSYSSTHSTILCGLEASKIYELDKENLGEDFVWASDPRFASLLQDIRNHHQETQDRKTAIGINPPEQRSSSQAATPPRGKPNELATKVVVGKLAKLLFVPVEQIDTKADFQSFGIDSMLGTELRNWLTKTFGFDISFVELVRKGVTPEEIGVRVWDTLVEKNR
ncbi:putative polyketide synthase [Delitschia confertaspora ATCC 74209]|uniref:Polyketide synthase n=1 Tax=Delitschia confertaspora ATCC 74209 TaxID=1513339 RepID=A0A9P4JFY2_9PLEO|nr:putative polyketide synthase [Delitschia confertaspora ATCC 74209]